MSLNSLPKNSKIVLPGGAGLVGQNLVAALKDCGFTHLVIIDKHQSNLEVLKKQHPDITLEYADVATPGSWQKTFEGAQVVIMLQAQIGGLCENDFIRNNIIATKNIIQTMKTSKVNYLIHISSSVIESAACDFYTVTKEEQEQLVKDSGIPHCILRPTLMFGWFDRKHLGWLSRFMKRVPIFPIPGHGKYMRQPLYVGDFCRIIISCLEKKIVGKAYNVSGLEKIDYVDLIRVLKRSIRSKAILMKLPYSLFYVLLKIWSVFDKDPPFTTSQLKALVTPDEFEVIDWPALFGVQPTPFEEAIDRTFHHPTYSRVVLEF